uniref:methylated diphthine methylhydrolase n=1 Tax=Haemonchus contortus TaxID=6289 RepID=A0A7I4YBB7_HAECO
MADDLTTASLPQYSVPGPQIVGSTKYQQLLAVIEELGKDIRPTYTGNKICAERLKRSIAHSRILVRECLLEAEKDRQKAAADAADSDSRIGSLYVLSHNLGIVRCIKAPGGVFRFDFLKPHVVIAAITDGSLFTASISDSPSDSSISVAEDILLDVSSSPSSDRVSCTDKSGCAYIVDLTASTVIVWTCAQRDHLVCTGGEDAALKVWDARSQSIAQRFNEFEAGVTFSEWQEDNLILTGSYDQHIRLFDMRNNREAIKTVETRGGVWHIENCQRAGVEHYLAACMYGGWVLFDQNLDIVKCDKDAGEHLLYGVTLLNENTIAYTTFNDFMVSTAAL